jgi:hypothetical protein
MERRKKSVTIPDAINCSVTKEFTQIPNELLRNPAITGKSKALLCLLLSNREGWKTHIITIKKMMLEGEEAIRTGLEELEEHGYLVRLKYREIETKVRRGSIWAYTDIPNNFNLETHLSVLQDLGFELFGTPKSLRNEPDLENPDVEDPDMENQVLKRLIKKDTIKNKQYNTFLITLEDFDKFWEQYPRKGSKGKALSSWMDLCTSKKQAKFRPDWQRVRAAIIKQKRSEQWQDPKLIPMASTWLNQKRWLDDASQMKKYNFNKNREEEDNGYVENTGLDWLREKERLENE